MTLEQNKKAREEAEAAFALLCETVGEQTERFWETMAQLSTGKLPPQSPTIQAIEPMTDDEASDLERECLGDFGVLEARRLAVFQHGTAACWLVNPGCPRECNGTSVPSDSGIARIEVNNVRRNPAHRRPASCFFLY